MFCSFIGLSPCDLILQDISVRTIKDIISLLNNRFDILFLKNLKAEFNYIINFLTKNVVFDYEDRNDRVMSKRLKAANMTSFGDFDKEQVIEHLRTARKAFTGNIRTQNGLISLKTEQARNIIMTLYNSIGKLRGLSDMISLESFSDEIFFGKSLTWWAGIRSLGGLSVLASERIATQDDVEKLESDALRLLSYIKDENITLSSENNDIPSVSSLQVQYRQLGGIDFSEKQHNLCLSFLKLLKTFNLKVIKEKVLNSLVILFLYCLKASLDYKKETVIDLESCGLYFINPVKAEYMVDILGSISAVPEQKIQLHNPEYGDTYEIMLNAVIAASQNNRTPIGASLTVGEY